MKILFVCRGNVGRSQMAEALFVQMTGTSHEVRSAGTKVMTKEGESRHGQLLRDLEGAEHVIDSLGARNLNVADNMRTQLDPALVEWADKIVVMAEPHTIPDYLEHSDKTVYWDIADPKGTSLEEHVRVLGEIEGKVKEFIKENNF